MVATVARSGLGQDFHQSVDVNFEVALPTNSETPPQDPWANIFPPTLLRTGTPPLEASPDVFGMYDAEDQVYRCLDCMHEIWGGSCSQCGRHYTGHASGEEQERRIAELEGILGWRRSVSMDESYNASGEEQNGRIAELESILGLPRTVTMDESDDGSYEGSFIDDEGSERYDSEGVEISSDYDEVTALATRQGAEAFSEGSEDGDEKVSDISLSDEYR